MAPESYGKAFKPGQHGFGDGGGLGGPPPSTLAAQLVENISTSARSRSGPDENSELKRLFGVIEKVKNNPDLVKTPEERVEHNHLLIYVCGGIVLERLKWDDADADLPELRTAALKAIHFLNVTFKETPTVLRYTPGDGAFMFRGCEPLWLWILPKVLKMLGHSQCLDLSGPIEELCQYILQLTSQHGYIWDLGPSFMQYFQTNLGAILARLRTVAHSPQAEFHPAIELPPQSLLQSFSDVVPQKCSYTIGRAEHAIRHASGLLSIMKNTTSTKIETSTSFLLEQNLFGLLDSFPLLIPMQVAWPMPAEIGLAPILQGAVDLAAAYSNSDGVRSVLSQKANITLAVVCGDVFEKPARLLAEDEHGLELRRVVCLALVQLAKGAIAHNPTSRMIASQLVTLSQSLVSENPLIGADTDVWRCVELLKQATASPNSGAFNEDVRSDRFQDGLLCEQVKKLRLEPNNRDARQPAAKRRKLAPQSSPLRRVVEQLCRLVYAHPTTRLDSLENLLIDAFPVMDEDDQCQAIELSTRISCGADGTLEVKKTENGLSPRFQCSFCGTSADNLCNNPDKSAKRFSSAVFSRIIRLPALLESRRPRVYAMIALRRVIRHSEDKSLWDLEKSGPGQWCLQSLNSSIRELRIAAGRALAVFIVERDVYLRSDRATIKRNQANALSILKSLSDKDAAELHETCIMAWGQVGRVVSDDELNLVLIKLVQYLGHRNMIVSAFAFSEILNLASSRRVNVRRLFQPFWASLAFSVAKDMVSKPQTTRMVAELLQTGVPDLLRHLQTHALPWLVLTKKRDVIQKIAEARGEEESWQPCLDNINLPSILALLLIQDAPNIAEHSMSLLRQISSHFDRFELVELLRTDPISIALELFKAGGDANEARKAQVRNALMTMATLLLADNADKKVKKSHKIGRYLQPHALGLTARLSETIADTLGSHPPVRERKQCLGAMEEMVRVCNSYVCIARPQISACLISALASDELRTAAFSCWVAMLTHMEEADIEALIETTFFIIDKYWSSFNDETMEKASELIKTLLEKHQQVLVEYSNKLPSLSNIPMLKGLAVRIDALRQRLDDREAFGIFSERLNHENSGVVKQALVELLHSLAEHQNYLQTSALSEQPDSVVTTLMRSLLDCSSKYNGWEPDIVRLCAESVGLIGCLDSNRLETTREDKKFVVVHNFGDAGETTDFVAFVLENVLVKAFLSTTDTKFQGFLSFAMQDLLDKTDFKAACEMLGQGESESVYRKWLALSDNAREVLTPFLASKFCVQPMVQQPAEYPIFRPGRTYANWLRPFVLDLLRNGQNFFSQIIFEPLQRLIKVQDLSVAEFLLPYVALHVVVGQENSSDFRKKVTGELASILQYQVPDTASYIEKEELKLLYEAVFRIIDYAMRWKQIKQAQPNLKPDDLRKLTWLKESLASLDQELISRRAVDCKEYARALFFLEPHLRAKAGDDTAEKDRLVQSLLDIYTQIDDPDGLDGVSTQLQRVDLNQQALNHRKAGRWTAAQTWYEIRLAESPENVDIQLDLLTCLKESGQHDVLLNYVEGMKRTANTVGKITPFAVEASWATGRWQTLEKYLRLYSSGDVSEDFNLGVGQALLALKERDGEKFKHHIKMMRDKVGGSMTYSTTSSLRACHDAMLKCHVLSDLELIGSEYVYGREPVNVLQALNRRLGVLGAYVSDKQYVLGVNRAAMDLMRPNYTDEDISSLWLASARLARKAGSMHQSFNAVLHAQQLGDGSAIIENARLLYKDGHHRKAIQVLQLAITTNSFIAENIGSLVPTSSKNADTQRNLLTARAYLLLAKWLDSTGQTHASALRSKYQDAAKTHSQWEKGHYYLGRHYKKVLESEKTLKPDDQTDEYLTGETAKLVIENYLRSLNFGTKYLYQTLPRILTLWLELGAQVDKPPDGKVSLSRELHARRKTILMEVYKNLSKNLARMPAFIFYTALPQIVARIAHPNLEVFKILEQMILRVVEAYPRQALWSLFSFMTTRQSSERRTRGLQILQGLRGLGKKVEGAGYDMKQLLRMGEKLAEQLLLACNNGDFQSNRTTTASITRDLNFNHKCTPCPLVVPIEACLTATLPTLTDNFKKHKAFSRDVITIDCFLDSVLVLGSLAKPRRLTARGSDGNSYNLLLKPKDDLRTDQRLMEFNGQINRSLKRDAESSRRQLYIKTYAVTPLNEECGIIEWVDGLKTIRDILLGIYKTRNVVPNYGQIAQLMKEASMSDASVGLFTEKVLGMFPPVLPDWFISQFPSPSTWFSARLKYTRSCAVMSMVGTILGLGDRHGENVLLEEGNGGIFHVDFNCLFDKGLTFAQPERVPFRLTHNMEAAMGIYRYEGPFRHCSELTLHILRQQEETLVTILEAFIYDPTLDLQRTKKRGHEAVKLNPTSVVESIKRKVRGLLPDESIPLGVEGQVEELIKQAVNPKNLAAMYIGWCPFL